MVTEKKENRNKKGVDKLTGNKSFVTKTENNPSYVVPLLKGLSKTRGVTWGNIPGSSELVAGVVSHSYICRLSYTHTDTF